jgi:hypothetical protein
MSISQRVDSLRAVTFDASGIETLDFSHNPELFSVVMMWSPIKNLNMLANPKLRVLWLDGCTALQTVDLRAQRVLIFILWILLSIGIWVYPMMI